MLSNAFNPLDIKPLSDTDENAAFPFEHFAPLPVIEEPIIVEAEQEQKPDNSAEQRIAQLEAMLAEKHTFDANMEREAYDKAYLAGEKAGLALGQKRAEQILERMEQLQQQAEQQVNELRAGMSEAIADIGGMLAEWLVGEITRSDRERMLAMAERAARTFPETDKMVMAVNQDDFSQLERLLEESDFKPHLLIDSSVKPGCMRIANEAQDVLIDPRAPIAEAVAQLKRELRAGEGVEHSS